MLSMNILDPNDILSTIKSISINSLEKIFDPIGDGLKKSAVLDKFIRIGCDNLVSSIKNGSKGESYNLCVVLS